MTDIIVGGSESQASSGYYGTVSGGDTFFSNRIGGDPWDNATEANKLASLKQATQIIERFNFLGEKNESSQTLSFPRKNSTTVPTGIEYATYLIAEKLLDEVTIEGTLEAAGVLKRKILGVETEYSDRLRQDHKLYGVPSAEAFFFIRPFLRNPNEIRFYKTV